MRVLKLTVEAYLKNIKLVSFFSFPFLLAFLIPFLAPTPTFTAIGATFLRTGSMYVDLAPGDIAVIIISFLLSLFLVSFAVVAINLVIKSQRASTRITTEIMQSLDKYVLKLFFLYLSAWILLLVVNLFAFEVSLNEWLTPLASLIVGLFLFYAPQAIVLEDLRPFQAMERSFSTVFRQFLDFLVWLVLAIVLLSVLDFIFLPFSRYLVLLINSIIVLPFLLMYQVQAYLAKYTILK